MLDAHGNIVDLSPYKEGELVDNRFLLKARIKQGGVAEIWDCEDKDIQLGMKRLVLRLPQIELYKKPLSKTIFEREYQIGQLFDHPNIETATGYGYDDTKEFPYTCMRYMDGVTLAELFKASSPELLPKEKAINIATCIGSAISHVHSKSFIHSDIKPAKIFIENNGSIKLFNFSIAREYSNDPSFNYAVLAMITPAYASPQVFNGEMPDPRDDIYSFGLILYQLFSGKHPFNKMPAPNAEKNSMQVNNIPSLSASQNKAIQGALEFNANHRVDNIEALLKELEMGN